MINCVQSASPKRDLTLRSNAIQVHLSLARAFLTTLPVISMRLQNDQLCAGCFAEERSLSTKQRHSSTAPHKKGGIAATLLLCS
jgi:hypothetical protein